MSIKATRLDVDNPGSHGICTSCRGAEGEPFSLVDIEPPNPREADPVQLVLCRECACDLANVVGFMGREPNRTPAERAAIDRARRRFSGLVGSLFASLRASYGRTQIEVERRHSTWLALATELDATLNQLEPETAQCQLERTQTELGKVELARDHAVKERDRLAATIEASCGLVAGDERHALASDITRRLHLCSHDELRVLQRVLQRLELGRERYGLLDLRKPRDWGKERGEELLDALLYDVMGDLAAEDAGGATATGRPT